MTHHFLFFCACRANFSNFFFKLSGAFLATANNRKTLFNHLRDEMSDDSDNDCYRRGGELPNVGENNKNRRKESQLRTTKRIAGQ